MAGPLTTSAKLLAELPLEVHDMRDEEADEEGRLPGGGDGVSARAGDGVVRGVRLWLWAAAVAAGAGCRKPGTVVTLTPDEGSGEVGPGAPLVLLLPAGPGAANW